MPRIIWIAYLDEEQERLWHTALSSQQIAVVAQSPEADIAAELEAVYGSERQTPEILLLDVAVKSPNSKMLQFGSICQWAMEKFNPPKIILVNPRQYSVGNLERNWALRRGAVDFLPKLTRDNYEELVVRVLEWLGRPCAYDLLRSALRNYWQDAHPEEEQTVIDLPASFVSAPPETVTNIKNPTTVPKASKYTTYRGVRIRR